MFVLGDLPNVFSIGFDNFKEELHQLSEVLMLNIQELRSFSPQERRFDQPVSPSFLYAKALNAYQSICHEALTTENGLNNPNTQKVFDHLIEHLVAEARQFKKVVEKSP